MGKVIEGECGLCGEFKPLSFEHVPPRSAFNDKPVFVQSFEHLYNKESHVYGKRMRSNRGFGGYTLCELCNNNTGSWYANDFAEFAQQGMNIISTLDKPRYDIDGVYDIKPLRVIKQILTMFMSADKIGALRAHPDLVKFILEKETKILPSGLKVFLYSTLSHHKRMIGYSVVADANLKIQQWCEVNFQPFGYLLAIQSDPAHEQMTDISAFAKFEYDQVVSVKLTTPYLEVKSPTIGIYGK